MCSASDSAVVRAKFMPDVRGVDRYKYFHRPVILEEQQSLLGSIDKQTSPRELPQIDLKPGEIIRISARVNGNGRSVSEKQFPDIKKTKKKNGLTNEYVLPQLNAKKCLGTKSEPRLSPRNVITNSSDLGRLRLFLTTEQRKNASNNPNYTYDKAKSKTNKNGSSEKTYPIKPLSSNGKIRRSQTLERLPQSQHNVSAPGSETSGASTKTITNRTSNTQTTTTQATVGVREINSASSLVQSTSPEIREFGTQTEEDNKDNSSHRTIEKVESYDSNASQLSSLSQKATQTDQIPFIDHLNRRLSSEKAAEVEQRAELFAIIDAALDETIDKHSRLRAHRFIAGSARKQAQIWKDAKDFVSGILIPKSIEEYNTYRSSS